MAPIHCNTIPSASQEQLAWPAKSLKPSWYTLVRGIRTRPQNLTRELMLYLIAQSGAL
jgi:hypothetical protein